LGLPTSGQKSVLVDEVRKALSGGSGSGAAKTTKRTKKAKDEDDEDDDDEVADAAPAAEPPAAKGGRASARVQTKQKAEAEKEKEVGKWKVEGSLIYLASSEIKGAEEIYSFDMDDTLIETKYTFFFSP